MKPVSQRQFDLARSNVRFDLKQYEAARAAHLRNPDRRPLVVEIRIRGLLNYRAALAYSRKVLSGLTPVKYHTYSEAAARRLAAQHSR